MTVADRFWAKVDRRGPRQCWLWTGAIDTPGYGAFKIDGKKRNSHRVAYELTYGRVLPGIHIMHVCDRRICCNPKHLKACTPQDNVADMDRKGRRVILRGDDAGMARLTGVIVGAMRAKYLATSASTRDIAREFGVEHRTAQKALRGESWAHLPTSADYREQYRAVASAKRGRPV